MLQALTWLIELLLPDMKKATDIETMMCMIIAGSIGLSYFMFIAVMIIFIFAMVIQHIEGFADRLHPRIRRVADIKTVWVAYVACVVGFGLSEITSAICEVYLIQARGIGFLDSQVYTDILTHDSELAVWFLTFLVTMIVVPVALRYVVKPSAAFIDCLSVIVKHDFSIFKHDFSIFKHELSIVIKQKLSIAKRRLIMFKHFMIGLRSALLDQAPHFIKTTAQHTITTLKKMAQSPPTGKQLLKLLKKTRRCVRTLGVFAVAVVQIGCENYYLFLAGTLANVVDMWDLVWQYMCADDPQVLLWMLSCSEQPELWDQGGAL